MGFKEYAELVGLKAIIVVSGHLTSMKIIESRSVALRSHAKGGYRRFPISMELMPRFIYCALQQRRVFCVDS